MNNLQLLDERTVFNKTFRVYGTPDEPLFVARDVAEWIEHSNPTEMVRSVDEDEKLNSTILSSGQNREVTLLTEDGLYEVLMQSRKPIAKKFKKKVKEILKSIRKHGMYAKDELLDNPDLLLDVIQKYKAEREEKKLLQSKIEQDKPKVMFAEALEIAKSSILVGELAKLLARNGIEDMGQNRLFKWLRANGYLHKSGEQYNLPTQYSIELEIIETKTTTINNPDGSVRVTKTPKITCKGQIYFINKFKNNQIA